MPKCIWSNGTLVCNSSPYYRCEGGRKHPFPTLRRLPEARRADIRRLKQSIRTLGRGNQAQLAQDLFEVVMVQQWSPKKSQNMQDIKEMVQLALADCVPAMGHRFVMHSTP